MITFFTIPKAFRGTTAIHQRNAIASWRNAFPDSQIFLFGDDDGVDSVATEFDCIHIPDIGKTELGTPLLNDAFKHVYQASEHIFSCYVNADIIFPPGTGEKVTQLAKKNRFIVGQRTDIDLDTKLDFSSPGITGDLDALGQDGELAPKNAMDYFVYPRKFFPEIPPFAVGRPGWDNWFLSAAHKKGLKLIDASNYIVALHQNHGYTHVKEARGDRWKGPEGDENYRLAGSDGALKFRMEAAHYCVDSQGRLKRQPFTELSTQVLLGNLDHLIGSSPRPHRIYYRWRRKTARQLLQKNFPTSTIKKLYLEFLLHGKISL